MPHDRPVVFLDSNVVLSYVRGQLPWLFSEPYLQRFKYAINPIIIQETILWEKEQRHPTQIADVFDRVDVLPIDFTISDNTLSYAKELRNRAVHSNDILIFASALNCDYFLTLDKNMEYLFPKNGPKVLTPEEFHDEVEMRE
jgi:predicted nucleic acid-binding protein